jgi:hypothetical protein
VFVPLSESFTATFTDARGFPTLSVTTPDTDFSWAKIWVTKTRQNVKTENRDLEKTFTLVC